ncbi:MAG: histidine kinase [Spirochaetales bacterium]|nr:histidine kinase [Spirochaetales bacterium]
MNRTIRKDLIFLLSLAIIIPFALITLLYISNVKNIIDNDVVSYQKALIKQREKSLLNIFDSVKIAQRATLGKILTDYIPITLDSALQKEQIVKLKDLFEYLYVIDNANHYINGIYVVFESGYVVSSRNGIRANLLLDREWIRRAWISGKEEVFTGIHAAQYNVAVVRDEYDSVMSFLQVFELPMKQGAKVLILIDIETTAFSDFVEIPSTEEPIPMYLKNIAEEGILLENSLYQELPEENRNEGLEIVEEIRPGKIDLHAFVRKDRILSRFNSAIVGTTIIISLIVLASLIVALILSRTITKPLHQLYLGMQQVGRGDFSPHYPSTKYKELSFLITRFQTMVSEVNELIETVVAKENESAEAKFHALQAQINPHFLYNTLDVIRGLALSEGNEDISGMTLALSRLFRYNVGNLSENTDLGSEIEYLHNYLQIQKFRFGDRIAVEIDIPEEYQKVRITRFILQPVIENAFKYGLELRGKGGFLKINARKESDSLLIAILDNGPGIDGGTLVEMNERFAVDPRLSSIKQAHGLDNVNLRLKLLYGNSYGLTAESEKNLWTKFTIKIPFSREEEHV